MKELNFGIFNEFWDNEQPNHLPLLNLRNTIENNEWNLEISLKRLENILTKYSKKEITRDLEILISEMNWRPQLVFCIALLKLNKDQGEGLVKLLWNKISQNKTFVMPQLAVTALLIDSNFKEKALEILKTRNSMLNTGDFDNNQLLSELCRTDREDKSSIAIGYKSNLTQLIKEGKI